MSNTSDNNNLTSLQKIILFAFVSLIVELPRFLVYLIDLNTGLGEIKYTLVFCAFPLALYIMHHSYWKRLLKFPNFIPFLSILLVFLLFQKYLTSTVDSAPYNGYTFFLWDQIRIYIYFLMLVNFGLDRVTFYKVIDYAFYSILLMCLITYAGYLNLIEISYYRHASSIIDASFTEATRAQHALNINRISFLFTYALLLLIIKQHNEKRFSKAYLFRDFTVILLFLGVIVINASRGAFLLFIVFTSYYIYFLWSQGVKDKSIKLIVSIFIFLIIVLSMSRVTDVLKNFEKSQRSQVALINQFKILQRQMDQEGAGSLRILNMKNAWANFSDHPFVGVGYYNAAKRHGTGTRSNNQYVQLLAAYGIIFFIIYIYYNYKLVVFRFSLLKRPEVALCVFFHAMHIIFRVPTVRVAILAYIAVFFFYNSKSIRSNSKI